MARNEGGSNRRHRPEERKEFDQRILELARVTRVTKGGKRMRFRAAVIIGDKKGRVGFGVAKGGDVTISVNKAVVQAKKRMLTVPLVNDTIPHVVDQKFAAASILLKPAPIGTGVKAGGAVRVVLELAGVPNVVAKILGSGNKINNAKATLMALKQLRLKKKAVETAAPTEAQAAPAVA
ncbi:30S ribosomal protein S5 [Candidatus Uhrbacteria bacterium]|nr:30S ribosomal protein S5 [Candidatus Uhrbacteria bacterium]